MRRIETAGGYENAVRLSRVETWKYKGWEKIGLWLLGFVCSNSSARCMQCSSDVERLELRGR
jgi:hypothetical protein